MVIHRGGRLGITHHVKEVLHTFPSAPTRLLPPVTLSLQVLLGDPQINTNSANPLKPVNNDLRRRTAPVAVVKRKNKNAN